MAELTEVVAEVEEFVRIGDFLNSDDVRTALVRIQNIIKKPDVPAERLPTLVRECQALGNKFAVLAKYYQTIGKAGKAESDAKNLYYTLSDEMDKLVMALKKFGAGSPE